MSTIDKTLNGSNFCGLDCIEQNSTIHPETCVDQVLTENDNTTTLDAWLRYQSVDPSKGFADYTSLTAWLGANLEDIESDNVPYASKSVYGRVRVGDNINVSDGVISVPAANINTLGLVKIGSNIAFYNNIIDVNIASFDNLGIVRLGYSEKIPIEFDDKSLVVDDIKNNRYCFPLILTDAERAGITIDKDLLSKLNFYTYESGKIESFDINTFRFNNSYISDSDFSIIYQLNRLESEFGEFDSTRTYPVRIDTSEVTDPSDPEIKLNLNAPYVYVPWTDTVYPALNNNSHASNTTYVVNGPGTATGWNNKFLKGDGSWAVPNNTTYIGDDDTIQLNNINNNNVFSANHQYIYSSSEGDIIGDIKLDSYKKVDVDIININNDSDTIGHIASDIKQIITQIYTNTYNSIIKYSFECNDEVKVDITSSEFQEFITAFAGQELKIAAYGDIVIQVTDPSDLSTTDKIILTFSASSQTHYKITFKYLKGYLTIVSKKSDYVTYTSI